MPWSCEPVILPAIFALLICEPVAREAMTRVMLEDKYVFGGLDVEYLEEDYEIIDSTLTREPKICEICDWLMQEFDWHGHTITKAVWVFYVNFCGNTVNNNLI